MPNKKSPRKTVGKQLSALGLAQTDEEFYAAKLLSRYDMSEVASQYYSGRNEVRLDGTHTAEAAVLEPLGKNRNLGADSSLESLFSQPNKVE